MKPDNDMTLEKVSAALYVDTYEMTAAFNTGIVNHVDRTQLEDDVVDHIHFKILDKVKVEFGWI